VFKKKKKGKEKKSRERERERERESRERGREEKGREKRKRGEREREKERKRIHGERGRRGTSTPRAAGCGRMFVNFCGKIVPGVVPDTRIPDPVSLIPEFPFAR
jgi:hypothetical protein